MSDWGRFRASPKRPPPKRGIKVTKTGTTWWGKRWIEALERASADYRNRLARGRSYARAGRTHDLIVKSGVVTARVTGSRTTPYKVKIEIAPLNDKAWQKAIATMAAEARFAADLLAGEMPTDVDKAFAKAGAALFPAHKSDLSTSCNCPDWANPCKHVAAAHYVLGEALDRDPFLLFELRGRRKDDVLDALRSARSGAGDSEKKGVSPAVPAVSLGRLRAADYDTPRAPLPALHLTFESPSASGALLRQLGKPRGWSLPAPPEEMLGPRVRAAADRARRIAVADNDAGETQASCLSHQTWPD